MKIIKYLDVYKQKLNNEGEVYDALILQNFTLPSVIERHRIIYIEPYYTESGRLYKNVSILTYDNGEKFKVVGNYKDFNKPIKKIGF
tara:strand:+ start:5558 stop:5818 length:261 start_codon:yes stop_codon:yes gene_type:complete